LAERIRAAAPAFRFFTRTGAGTDIAKGKEEREFDGHRYIMERGISPTCRSCTRAKATPKVTSSTERRAQFQPDDGTAAR